jgi:hypothetical protein
VPLATDSGGSVGRRSAKPLVNAVWWAREELNLRPLPCQQNARNRCADGRSRRSRSTVRVEVKCSHRVQLNALPTRPGFIDTTLIIAPGSTSHLLCTTVHLHVGQQPCYLGDDARLQACPRRFRSVIRPLRRPDNPACSPVALAGPGRSYSGWSLRRGPRGHRPSSVGSRRSAAGHGVGDRDVWLVHNRAHGTFRGPAITGNLR